MKAEGRGLYGLINNAGVLVLGPLIEVTEEDLAFQMNVNVFGPYRVTKAFAPLLIESQGRVATTGSISGIGTWGLGGPYTMSKHAVEAYTDVLAIELASLGVRGRGRRAGQLQVRDHGEHGRADARIGLLARGFHGAGPTRAGPLRAGRSGQFKEPDEVADAYLDFLTSENPKRRYMVVPNEREAEFTIRSHIRRLVQLNADQPYEYSREELIAMIDEATAELND